MIRRKQMSLVGSCETSRRIKIMFFRMRGQRLPKTSLNRRTMVVGLTNRVVFALFRISVGRIVYSGRKQKNHKPVDYGISKSFRRQRNCVRRRMINLRWKAVRVQQVTPYIRAKTVQSWKRISTFQCKNL